jgi:hypothetical protein
VQAEEGDGDEVSGDEREVERVQARCGRGGERQKGKRGQGWSLSQALS